MIEIVEVISKKQRKQFVNFPLKLYKNNPYFVPPLYMDEMNLFTEKNVYNKTCESSFYLALKNGEVVGRIQGIIQKQFNEIHGEKRARFTRFDSINDEEVATKLFEAVENWAKQKGMNIMCGPLGYSDLEREGLLIEGFEELSTFEEQYNYPYYQKLIENLGYNKEIDWVESKIKNNPKYAEKLAKVAKRSLELSGLHVADSSISKKAYIKKYKDGFFECLDECYRELYGTVPFTEEMKNQMIDQFMLIMNKKYLLFICDKDEKVVAFALCLPGIGKSLQKSGGRLTPFALIRLLKAVKNPEIIDLGLIGVLPKYQKLGINAVALDCLVKMLSEGKVKHCETNLNLETNDNVQSQWKYFDAVNHKRRRSFIKNLD